MGKKHEIEILPLEWFLGKDIYLNPKTGEPTGHSMSAQGTKGVKNTHLVYLDWESLSWREKLRILPGEWEKVYIINID